MNLQSEITFFSEMGAVDKARLMASFLGELTSEARATYGPAQESVHDAARLRFTNEPTRWRRRWSSRPIEGRCRTSSATTPRFS